MLRNLPHFENNFMAKFFQKKPNRFQEYFWHMFHIQIKNDASIDSKAQDVATALTYAVSYKRKEMAEFLIENDANVNSNCTNLKTPLYFALMLNHEEFVLLLLQNGASLNVKDQDKRTPIEEGLMRKQMTAFKN